jgi:RNA polymerase sigma-70 factor (ECF subfamily)
MMSTEARLLEASFREQVPRLLGFCSRLIGDRQAAEDITQEVFLQAHQAGQSDPSWLFVCARSRCIDYLRRRGLWTRLCERLLRPSLALASFEDGLVDLDLGWRVLSRLSVKARSLLLLQAYARLSYQELAEAFETSVSSIAVMLHRARAQAARAIGEEESR